MKPYDNQIDAFSGEINLYLNHNYKNEEAKRLEWHRLRSKFQEALTFPVSEISPDVWDRMNSLAEEALLN